MHQLICLQSVRGIKIWGSGHKGVLLLGSKGVTQRAGIGDCATDPTVLLQSVRSTLAA